MIEKISVAPMVDRTTEHFRNFIRMFNDKSTLYTEMITSQAIINGDENKLLSFKENQHKVVLQIATADEDMAKRSIEIANKYDYDEININAGCPSNRVSDNNMGAYLMSDIDKLCKIIKGIKSVTDKEITVKHRIGIDGTGILENDRKIVSYKELLDFTDELYNVGIKSTIVHARIAILKGLSPSENRTIPPLDYEMVYRLKKDRPYMNIEINGGIKTLDDVKEHLKYVDSVMIGRAVYDNPMLLNYKKISRIEILEKMLAYISDMKTKPYHFIMHTMGLFYATKYSKIWKNFASDTRIDAEKLKNIIEKFKEYDIIKM